MKERNLLGTILSEYRKIRGLNMSELAKKLTDAGYPVAETTISRYENGTRKPNHRFIYDFSSVLKLSDEDVSLILASMIKDYTSDLIEAYKLYSNEYNVFKDIEEFNSDIQSFLTKNTSRKMLHMKKSVNSNDNISQVEIDNLLDSLNVKGQIRQRISDYISQGFLLPNGLIFLRNNFNLTWREIDVLLSWINPVYRGSIHTIGNILFLSYATINEYVRNIIYKLGHHLDDYSLYSEESEKDNRSIKKGIFISAYQWAIKEDIVNPYGLPLQSRTYTPIEQDIT